MTAQGPIIIIGAARSGTKFLRDVLGAGFGTAVVPYDVNYIWRFGAENAPDDRLDPKDLTNHRREFIKRSLRQVTKASAADVLIEKTVSNSLRVSFVESVYPNARYVHLVRDGRDVVESALRQWQKPPNWKALLGKLRGLPMRNLSYVFWFGRNFFVGLISGRKGGQVWGPRYPGITQDLEAGELALVCSNQWVSSVETALDDLSIIDKSRVFTVRYEDLIANDKVLRNLVDQLKFSDPETILRAYTSQVVPPAKRKWELLDDDVQSVMMSNIYPTLKRLGYEAV